MNLEDFLTEALAKEKEAKKKTNATNARAMNGMKQKLKRSTRPYEADIEKLRADPDMPDEEEEEDIAPKTPKVSKKGLAPDEIMVDGVPTKGIIAVEDDDEFTTVGKGGKSIQFTAEGIFKHLKTVMEARGKKNTDRLEQIRILDKLLEVAVTPYQKIRVLLALISARFDYNPSMSTHMTTEMWNSAEKEINQLLSILEGTDQFIIVETVAEDYDDEEDIVPQEGETVKVRGSVVSYVDRLDDELTKSLQNIDPHTTEYVDRLKDETSLYATITRSQIYFEKVGLADSQGRVIMRRLEHLYYKPDQVIRTVEESAVSKLPVGAFAASTDASNLIHTLCTYLYENGDSLLRTRAMLCHIYHHALHNRFHLARDMLLMSHLQETIPQADVGTQILYNRTMVQVGLCAFRGGMVKEAQGCLQEICGTGRVKELLAQGIQPQRFQQVSPEQEKLEKQRQLPFHMHINLELLESAYLTCSMLLEIPAMAAAGSNPEARKRVISKPFRRMLDYNERQVFLGPPENTRDHIMQASKALSAGEWERCRELIQAIKIWDLLPDASIKEMLGKKVQEEGLRTYLFTYASYYDTIGIQQLSTMFDLSAASVTSTVSKMIWNDELAASLDQVHGVVVLHRVEPSKLQTLALMLADKAANMLDGNERSLEQKTAQSEKNAANSGGLGSSAGQDKRAVNKGGRTQVPGGQRIGGAKGRSSRSTFNNGLGNAVKRGAPRAQRA